MFEGEDIIPYSILPEICPDARVICFGHWHKDQGIVKTSEKQTVVNIGSMTRGSLSQDNIDRIPSVALIKVSKEDIVVEKIPLKVKPAAEVFDFEKRERQQKRDENISKFVEKLYEMRERDLKRESVEDQISSEGIPEKVREKANQIWGLVSA